MLTVPVTTCNQLMDYWEQNWELFEPKARMEMHNQLIEDTISILTDVSAVRKDSL